MECGNKLAGCLRCSCHAPSRTLSDDHTQHRTVVWSLVDSFCSPDRVNDAQTEQLGKCDLKTRTTTILPTFHHVEGRSVVVYPFKVTGQIPFPWFTVTFQFGWIENWYPTRNKLMLDLVKLLQICPHNFRVIVSYFTADVKHVIPFKKTSN